MASERDSAGALGEDRALYNEAREAMDQGELDRAVELFRRSSELYPHFKTLELWADCLVGLGRLTEAVVLLAAATTLNRGVRAPSLLSEVLLKLGELHDAREMAEIALARDPRNRKALEIKERLSGLLPIEPEEDPG